MMTTEQKAEAYEKSLARAKKLLETCDSNAVAGWCEYIFPELKKFESDDIRKELIEHCREYEKMFIMPETTDKCKRIQKWIAWLEMSGEDGLSPVETDEDAVSGTSVPGTADEPEESERIEFHPEPRDEKTGVKFCKGEWITNGSRLWRITRVLPFDYELEDIFGAKAEDTISHVDEHFHRWTMEDAKYGDVLVVKGHPFIYGPLLIRGYRGVSPDGSFKNYREIDICPATREQRDLLISKLKEPK